MPIYNYKCSKCKEKQEKFFKKNVKEIQCKCGETMRKVPATAQNLITEQNIAGKPIRKGVTEQLKKRRKAEFLKKNIAEHITKLGKDHATKHGWLNPKTGKQTKEIDDK